MRIGERYTFVPAAFRAGRTVLRESFKFDEYRNR